MEIITWLFAGGLVTVLLILGWTRLFGFTAQRPQDYETGTPFEMRRHLSGPFACDGVIYGPTGRVVSRFSADFDIAWDGNHGVMAEHFRYDSGTRQDREWRLELGNDGTVRAEADDVVGTGTGQQHGSALHLKYRIRLTKDAGGHVLDVTDWMYLAPDGAIVNRSQFRKFGIKVAELVAVMRKTETDEREHAA
jgi:hypothetical protein